MPIPNGIIILHNCNSLCIILMDILLKYTKTKLSRVSNVFTICEFLFL